MSHQLQVVYLFIINTDHLIIFMIGAITIKVAKRFYTWSKSCARQALEY